MSSVSCSFDTHLSFLLNTSSTDRTRREVISPRPKIECIVFSFSQALRTGRTVTDPETSCIAATHTHARAPIPCPSVPLPQITPTHHHTPLCLDPRGREDGPLHHAPSSERVPSTTQHTSACAHAHTAAQTQPHRHSRTDTEIAPRESSCGTPVRPLGPPRPLPAQPWPPPGPCASSSPLYAVICWGRGTHL